MRDMMLTLVLIGVAFFTLIISFLGVASLFGGSWAVLAGDLVQFMPWIVVFALAFFVLVALLGGGS